MIDENELVQRSPDFSNNVISRERSFSDKNTILDEAGTYAVSNMSKNNENVEETEDIEIFELDSSIDILNFYKDYRSVESIAKTFNISEQTVNNVLREFFRNLTGNELISLSRKVDEEFKMGDFKED